MANLKLSDYLTGSEEKELNAITKRIHGNCTVTLEQLEKDNQRMREIRNIVAIRGLKEKELLLKERLLSGISGKVEMLERSVEIHLIFRVPDAKLEIFSSLKESISVTRLEGVDDESFEDEYHHEEVNDALEMLFFCKGCYGGAG